MGCRRPGYHLASRETAEKKDTMKSQGFYHTSAWRRIRVQALQRDHYLCQACLKNNRFTKATEVHHIKELEDHPELALDLDNLQSLCWDCHEKTKDHRRCSVEIPKGVKVIKITDGSEQKPTPGRAPEA